MKPITVVIPHNPEPFFEKTLLSLTKSDLVERIVIVEPHGQGPREPTLHPGGAISRPDAGGPSSAGVSQESKHLNTPRCHVLVSEPLSSQKTLSLILSKIRTKYLLLLPGTQPISIEPKTFERILSVAKSTKAGMVYSDFYDES